MWERDRKRHRERDRERHRERDRERDRERERKREKLKYLIHKRVQSIHAGKCTRPGTHTHLRCDSVGYTPLGKRERESERESRQKRCHTFHLTSNDTEPSIVVCTLTGFTSWSNEAVWARAGVWPHTGTTVFTRQRTQSCGVIKTSHYNWTSAAGTGREILA